MNDMIRELFERYPSLAACEADILAAEEQMMAAYKSGGKIMVCGNGGSCADSEHIVGELMKGFLLKREVTDERVPEDIRKKLQGGLPAISLPSHSALLTAYINDVDPEMIYAQLLYGYAKPCDVFLGLSTSGNSKNVVNAAVVAKSVGIVSIALTGERESKLSELCDITIRVPGTETFKIQELHLPVYHYLCASVEKYFFG